MNNKKYKLLSYSILKWYKDNQRELPWRNTKDPYIIWLSEIILQQTRVDQGLPYFNKFVTTFPTIKELAAANEETILSLWQGLGYYSRARNLHTTAKYIVKHCNGQFPNSYNELIKLKGIGPYTAAAIASFAFNEAKAVVDGNVYRVLSRYWGIDYPINSTEGIKYFASLAQECLPNIEHDIYNQAIMEFGALACTAKNPNCINCCLNEECTAFATKKTTLYPIKEKKIKKKIRHFNFLFVEHKNSVYMKKRNDKDIWQGLYTSPLFESNILLNKNELCAKFGIKDCDSINQKEFKHLLTHQTIIARFIHIKLKNSVKTPELLTDYKLVKYKEWASLPKPILFTKFLDC